MAGETEESIYHALGLDWVPPELREMRGEIDAAAAHALPALVTRGDLRGDLHMHTTETDGKDDIRSMAEAARDAGLEYIAITDHSQSLAMANGLDERRALAHAERIRAIDAEGIGVRLLAGIECDIRPDGTLDLADDCLAALDIVVVSVHSAFNQDREQMTDRVLRAIENPHVDVIGHPTGRLILRRSPYALDIEAIVDAAARNRVALEINSQVDRLDLSDVNARLARERGRPHRHLERLALARGARRANALGRGDRPPRLAHAGRRPEHTAVRRLEGRLAPPPETIVTQLRMLSTDDKIAEIRRLYFQATKHTIQDDLAKALDLLKSLPSEEERERATVYMEGMAQMRKDWGLAGRKKGGTGTGKGPSKKGGAGERQ